jgi:adenosylhomocysteine nucleosidase
MRIAIVTAMAEEILPIYKKLGAVTDETVISGVKIRKLDSGENTVFLATSGIGEIRAALTVQLLADLFDVEAVLNFGFVGALNRELNVGDLVIVKRAVHHQFDIAVVNGVKKGQYDGRDSEFFDLDEDIITRVCAILKQPFPFVTVASGDKFIAANEDKISLRRDFGADICEMEAAGLALACERNNIPLFSMKVVSDKADESAAVSFSEVLEKGMSKYEHAIPKIIQAVASKQGPLPPKKRD